MRDAILRQRQVVMSGEEAPAPVAPAPADDALLLTETRDILARIEERLPSGER